MSTSSDLAADSATEIFDERLHTLREAHEFLITRPNEPVEAHNGIYRRYRYPVLTAAHTPLFWRY
ncbi:MAG TPA: hypothetical protein VKP65_01385, partial [Rhodothermales bacterium]|nr:hypothetical protein [Rhodothermales bacterium]